MIAVAHILKYNKSKVQIKAIKLNRMIMEEIISKIPINSFILSELINKIMSRAYQLKRPTPYTPGLAFKVFDIDHTPV